MNQTVAFLCHFFYSTLAALFYSFCNYCIDIDAGRLETAKTCGASHIVKVEKTDNGKEIAKKIQHVVGYQLDQTIECTGAKSAISAGIYVIYNFICTVMLCVVVIIGHSCRWLCGFSWLGRARGFIAYC